MPPSNIHGGVLWRFEQNLVAFEELPQGREGGESRIERRIRRRDPNIPGISLEILTALGLGRG